MAVKMAKGIVLVASIFLANVSPVSAETLTDAFVTAYRNSGLLEQNRAVLRAADEDVAQAVANLRPVLSYSLGSTYSDTSSSSSTTTALGLQAEMLLYDFGSSDLAVEAAKEAVLATRAVLLDVENTVLLNTVRAYVAVRRSISFVELRENNVRLLNQQLRATRDRFEVGEVTRTDVSLAEARLAAARSGLAAERGGLARAQEQYRTIVGRFPGTLATPPSPPAIPGTEEAAKEVARKENPAIDQVQHQISAAELTVERATRSLYPTLNASGSVSVDDDSDTTKQLSLSLSGPIYAGGALASGIRKANAQRDQVRALLHTTALTVDQQVGEAYANLAVAIASIEAFEAQVKASQLALEGVREELQLGARTTLEVLDQEQELLDAQTNLVGAEVDRYTAVYEVLDAMGILTASHLGLGVPTYDPAAYYNAVKNAPTVNVSPQGERLDRVMRALRKQ